MPLLNPQYYTKKFKLEDIEEIGFTTMNMKSNDKDTVRIFEPIAIHIKMKDGTLRKYWGKQD